MPSHGLCTKTNTYLIEIIGEALTHSGLRKSRQLSHLANGRRIASTCIHWEKRDLAKPRTASASYDHCRWGNRQDLRHFLRARCPRRFP